MRINFKEVKPNIYKLLFFLDNNISLSNKIRNIALWNLLELDIKQIRIMDIIRELEKELVEVKNFPNFKSGDTVTVSYKIKEGLSSVLWSSSTFV